MPLLPPHHAAVWANGQQMAAADSAILPGGIGVEASPAALLQLIAMHLPR